MSVFAKIKNKEFSECNMQKHEIQEIRAPIKGTNTLFIPFRFHRLEEACACCQPHFSNEESGAWRDNYLTAGQTVIRVEFRPFFFPWFYKYAVFLYRK